MTSFYYRGPVLHFTVSFSPSSLAVNALCWVCYRTQVKQQKSWSIFLLAVTQMLWLTVNPGRPCLKVQTMPLVQTIWWFFKHWLSFTRSCQLILLKSWFFTLTLTYIWNKQNSQSRQNSAEMNDSNGRTSDAPFHILTAMPLRTSNRITRPKLSVVAARWPSGDGSTLSPERRLS